MKFITLDILKKVVYNVDTNARIYPETELLWCVKFSRILTEKETEYIYGSFQTKVINLEDYSFFKVLLGV